jgi:hypothetical protein
VQEKDNDYTEKNKVKIKESKKIKGLSKDDNTIINFK